MSKLKENWLSNVCHSSQPLDSKIIFSPNSSSQNDFFNWIELYTFFLLYKQGFHVPICLLGPKDASKRQVCNIFFFSKKLHLLKIFKFLIRPRFFYIWFFLQYWHMWKHLNRSEMYQKNLNTKSKPKNPKAKLICQCALLETGQFWK